MMRILPTLALVLCAVGLSMPAPAAEQGQAVPSPQVAPSTQAAGAPAADPRVALLKLLPAGSKLEDLRPSPISGIYEYMQGADISYLTADGKFFIDGNVYDMGTRENLTEELRTHARSAMINAVPESQMVIFSPKNPQYT